jgi:hypothetical protein
MHKKMLSEFFQTAFYFYARVLSIPYHEPFTLTYSFWGGKNDYI